MALGNEIYLTDTREKSQKYYHFILIAKNRIGYKQLCELSSTAWYNCYMDRGMERVPLLKDELKNIIGNNKGNLLASSACLGGELPSLVSQLIVAEKQNNEQDIFNIKTAIHNFITFCLEIFGEDFYIEIAPATSKDQVNFNKRVKSIAEAYNIKITIGTDAHYLTSNERYVHKAYLNSKEGDREVDSFYEFARLMTIKETIELLKESFHEDFIQEIFNNSNEMMNKIEFFSLEKHQSIPEVDVKDYPKILPNIDINKYPVSKQLFLSDNKQERYWINQCYEALLDKGIGYNETYLNRLEEEARIKKIIGEKLQTCMFAYPNTLQHYVDLFWDCGSTVGAGRGSACSALNHYLLGITQLDPIEWNFPFFRYLNEERIELGDIDLDLAPSKLQKIFSEIRKERGELGLVQVCTFGTEGTKSAILSSCRGYRSADCPDGIDSDEAQYISSLVPQERGFLWTIKDLTEGNPEKDRKPNKTFIQAVNKYPGLLDIIKGVEGLVCRHGIHASGVILFDENIYDSAAIMRASNGSLTTQWDLHAQESAGSVKYDFLLTSVQDIIIQTIQLLQKDNVIDNSLSLREVYDKYLHPSVLPQDDEKMWNALANNEVLSCFQFDSPVGAEAAKKIKPKNPVELADANGLMRLMPSEPGAERPIDKYVRFKNNINLWYQEMSKFGLTKEEQKSLEPYFLQSFGVPPSQEQLMLMLMDENICHFTLGEANAARKIVGKKQMNKIPELHDKVITQAKSKQLGEYVWKYGAGPQMGYSFSIIHATSYSFIGMQTLYLATHFNSIYWNTACLIVNSGSLEDNSEEEIVDIYAPEADDLANGVTFEDLPDKKGKIRKTSSVDYVKIAKAIGEIRSAGINMSLVNINESDIGFKPDVKNNRILYGLKGLVNVGEDIIKDTIAGRPYSSPKDYLYRIKPKRQAMVSLIKGGAFDDMMDRKLCMAWYIYETCDKKKRLTLQNMPGLLKYNVIPDDDKLTMGKRIYEFTRYLKSVCKNDKVTYKLDERAISFLTELEKDNLIITKDNEYHLSCKDWDKFYQKEMDIFRDWITTNKEEALLNLNSAIFKEDWDKYAIGNLSSWEMEALCFYYHEHELAHLNNERYGIVNFFNLPEEPVVEKVWRKGDKEIKMFKLEKIAGTCIAKDKNKSTLSLLTLDGVVNVKMNREYFAMFDRTISEIGDDGKKHRIEKSFFTRGSMLMFQGIRSGDNFLPKKYSKTGMPHRMYKIDAIDENGFLTLRSERYQAEEA